MQKIRTEPYSLGSHHIFIESYWQIYSKSIISADLFEDGVTAHPMLKLSCLTWWWSQKLIRNSFHLRTALRGLGSLSETQLTPKKDSQKSHHVVASSHLEDYTNKAILRVLSVPPSLLYLCGSMSRGAMNRGHRSSPACIAESSRSCIKLSCQLKRKIQPLLTHYSALHKVASISPGGGGGQKYHLQQKSNQV